jgi:hypothetical protein
MEKVLGPLVDKPESAAWIWIDRAVQHALDRGTGVEPWRTFGAR